VLATTLWDQDLWLVQWGAVLGASLAAAVTDVSSRRILNVLTVPVLAGGLAWSAVSAGAAGLADSMLAVLLLALPYVLLFMFAGGGGGDAKLMGALGAWLGLVNGLILLGCVAASGVILALAFAVAKRQVRSVIENLFSMLVAWLAAVRFRQSVVVGSGSMPAVREMTTVPYGVAIFAGACLAFAGVAIWRLS